MRPVELVGRHSTEGIAPDAGLCPVKVDQTCPVEEIRLGELTGNDRTLELQRPVSFIGASGQLRDRWNQDTWLSMGDRTLRSSVRSTRPERPISPTFAL